MPLVVVERFFEKPWSRDDLNQAMEDNTWCFDTNNVTWLESFFAQDGTRCMCVYDAPDLESVRRANASSNVPSTRIWAASKHP
jgi:hypothetical protein